MSNSRYFLHSHAFLCQTDGYWVVLDVHRDKYLCIRRELFDMLGPWLFGWSEDLIRQSPHDSTNIPPEAIHVASDLMAQGILSDTSEGTKAIRPINLPIPARTLEAAPRRIPFALQLIYMPAFLHSSATADDRLNQQAFEQIVGAISSRKNRKRPPDRSFDFKKAAKLIEIFNALRWFYPRSYLCLFDSLALLEFLARNGLFPSWVFGVTTDPFEAHCWLQEGKVILNDTIERVSRYNPIMCL